MQFTTRLEALLKDFDLQKAVALSDELHAYEVRGGRVTAYADSLWDKLTDRILSAGTINEPKP